MKPNSEPAMKRVHLFLTCLLLILGAGCGTLRGAGDVARGRQALIEGNNQAALGYFLDAEETNPTYVYGADLPTEVSSYIGRAQYLTGNYAQAQRTLEMAISQNPADNLARLYLGLTLARQGDTQKAPQLIDQGLRGIHESLDYIAENFKFTYGQYWDPGRAIRSAIERDRAMIAGGKIDWPTLIADGESIALQTEREPDMARLQERSQRSLSMD
ncbi:MAG TPA: tetratricopeptide repeat protein [Candidatus Binatia bacterium]|jgi:tetratricopeptide (TPR) repeat protein